MNTLRDQRGQTLIEVLLSIIISSAVALAVFSAFQLIDALRTRQEGAGDVTWEADWVVHSLEAIAQRGIATPGRQEISETLTLNDGSSVVLEGGALVAVDSTGSSALTSSRVRVSSVSFENLGGSSPSEMLKVSFTLGTTASDSQTAYEHAYTTSILVR